MNKNLRLPFYIRSNPDNTDCPGGKHIVVISDVVFTIGDECGDQ